jgi:adenosylhomocysteine nucleosidase
MESDAVAHVVTVTNTPFIIFRSLSDLAGGGPGENEVGTFFGLAANNSARVMVAFLKAWPGN